MLHERIRLRIEPGMGNTAETRAKYSGLLTGRIAVARLQLNEAIETGDVAEASRLREMIVDLEKRLETNRSAFYARKD